MSEIGLIMRLLEASKKHSGIARNGLNRIREYISLTKIKKPKKPHICVCPYNCQQEGDKTGLEKWFEYENGS